MILYELVLGRSPHDLSGTVYEVLRRITEEEVTPPRQVDCRLDRDLEALLLKALARDPEARYASVAEFGNDIGHYLNHEPITAKPPTIPYLLRKRLRKHRRAVVIAGVALSVLFLLNCSLDSRCGSARSGG